MVDLLQVAEPGRFISGIKERRLRHQARKDMDDRDSSRSLIILGNRCMRCSRTLRTDLLVSMYRVSFGI